MSELTNISDELRERVIEFSDQKIINVIKQANLYPKDMVNGAKVIAGERGWFSL